MIYSEEGKIIYAGGMFFGYKYGWGEEYYGNQIIMNKGFYFDDKLHGDWCKSYSIKGDLVFEGVCQNGFRIGPGKLFHPNGNLRYFGNFKDDMIHDKSVNIYHENGMIETHCNFYKGQKLGSFSEYHANGKMKCKGKYFVEGFFDEFNVVYRKNGLIKYCGKIDDSNYVDGKEYGKRGELKKCIKIEPEPESPKLESESEESVVDANVPTEISARKIYEEVDEEKKVRFEKENDLVGADENFDDFIDGGVVDPDMGYGMGNLTVIDLDKDNQFKRNSSVENKKVPKMSMNRMSRSYIVHPIENFTINDAPTSESDKVIKNSGSLSPIKKKYSNKSPDRIVNTEMDAQNMLTIKKFTTNKFSKI